MICSKSLHGTDVSEMGRKLSGSWVAPDLCTGTTLFINQSLGSSAVRSDCVNIRSRMIAEYSAVFFKNFVVMPSQPQADEIFSLSMMDRIPSELTTMISIRGNFDGSEGIVLLVLVGSEKVLAKVRLSKDAHSLSGTTLP